MKAKVPSSSHPYPRRSAVPALKKVGKKPAIHWRSAEETALRLLARRDYSGEEMRRKLTAKGFPFREIDDTVRKLEGRRVLDDFRYAQHLAMALAQEKFLGPQRLSQKLFQKGIPADLAQTAVAIAEAALSVKERLEHRIKGKLKGRRPEELTPKEKRKLAGALYRNGFQWEDIREAMGESGGFAEE